MADRSDGLDVYRGRSITQGTSFLFVQRGGDKPLARFYDPWDDELTRPATLSKLCGWTYLPLDHPTTMDEVPPHVIELLKAEGWL